MTRIRGTVFFLLCLTALTVLTAVTVCADMGPKPSVVVDFTGLEGETYFATLLSKNDSTGPYSVLSKTTRQVKEDTPDYDIFLKFVEYQDEDGYYFLQFLQNCTQTHQLTWTYYPPQTFKVLLYFPDEERFLVSATSYERYAFDSYFHAAVSRTEDTVTLTASYQYAPEIASMLVRIVLTIAVELVIACAFGFRQPSQLRFITLVNAVTQIGLNLALNIVDYFSGWMAFAALYFLLEVMIVIAEAVLYTVYLRRSDRRRIPPAWSTILYAVVANGASFALGWGISHWMPGIF